MKITLIATRWPRNFIILPLLFKRMLSSQLTRTSQWQSGWWLSQSSSGWVLEWLRSSRTMGTARLAASATREEETTVFWTTRYQPAYFSGHLQIPSYTLGRHKSSLCSVEKWAARSVKSAREYNPTWSQSLRSGLANGSFLCESQIFGEGWFE